MVAPGVRYAASLVAGILIFLLIYNLGNRGDETIGHVVEVFGPAGQAQRDGAGYYVDAPHLEGRFGADEWSLWPQAMHTFPPIQVDKPNDSPTDRGAGSAMTLPALALPLEIRIREAARLSDYTAKWGVYETASQLALMETERDHRLASFEAGCVFPEIREPITQPATRPLVFEVTRPGAIVVTVELYKGERRAAALCEPLVAGVTAHWTIHSEVKPSSFMVPEQEAAESGDEFTFPAGTQFLPTSEGRKEFRVVTSTEYDGQYLQGSSHQIDLEIRQADENVETCVASRGPMAPPEGGARAAVHHLDPPLQRGSVTVRVGGGRDCSGMEPSQGYFNGQRVPYVLSVRVEPRPVGA